MPKQSVAQQLEAREQAQQGQMYQPQSLPGMGVGFADVPPEKRFDTVWIQSARQLIEFSPSADTTLKRLMELQQLMWGSGGESLTFDRALDTASAEFEYMLGEAQKGVDIGREWYRADIKRARASLTAIYPTLAQDANWEFFMVQLALLSPNKKVRQNLRDAMTAYESWTRDNKMPAFKDDSGKQFGVGGIRLAQTFNKLYEKQGSDPARFVRWMASETTIKGVNDLRKELGFASGTTGGGKPDEKVPWCRLFGPKVSEFFLNGLGDHTRLTLDLWAFRAYRRWKGQIKPFKKVGNRKDKGNPEEVDIRVSDKDRAEAIQLFSGLAKKFGCSMSEAQAVMWYYEKRLYQKLGQPQSETVSLGDVAEEVYRERTDPAFKAFRGSGSAGGAKPKGGQGQPSLPYGQGEDANLRGVGGGAGGGIGQAAASASKAVEVIYPTQLRKAEHVRLQLGKSKRTTGSWITDMGSPKAFIPKEGRMLSHTKNTQLAGLEALTTWMGMATPHRDSKGASPYDQHISRDKYVVRDPAIEEKTTGGTIFSIDDVRARYAKEKAAVEQRATSALSQIGSSRSAMFSSSNSEFYYILHPSARQPSEWEVSMFALMLTITPTGRFFFASKEKASSLDHGRGDRQSHAYWWCRLGADTGGEVPAIREVQKGAPQ